MFRFLLKETFLLPQWYLHWKKKALKKFYFGLSLLCFKPKLKAFFNFFFQFLNTKILTHAYQRDFSYSQVAVMFRLRLECYICSFSSGVSSSSWIVSLILINIFFQLNFPSLFYQISLVLSLYKGQQKSSLADQDTLMELDQIWFFFSI